MNSGPSSCEPPGTVAEFSAAAVLAAQKPPARHESGVPEYLRRVYAWAYLNSLGVWFFDRQWVVSAILWGNYRRLQRALLAEFERGSRVLQASCVYGDLSNKLAAHIGPEGRLDVIDVAPIQVENCRDKLGAYPWAGVRRADAAWPVGISYDTVGCFFLLHEMPDDYKRAAVDALLASVAGGGKVVFVDYHRPHPAHPIGWITRLVFAALEPFAGSLLRHPIQHFASAADRYEWRTEIYFGGLYQKTIATRR